MRVEVVRNNVPDIPLRVGGSNHLKTEFNKCGIHIHDEIEILVVIGGKMWVSTDDECVELGQGDVAVINRRVPHETKTLVRYTGSYMLQFRPEKLPGHESEFMNRYLSVLMTDGMRKLVFVRSGTEAAKKIAEYIICILEEKIELKKNYDSFMYGYMELLLGTLYRYNVLEDVRANYSSDEIKKVWPVIEFIDKNYSRTITLDMLCEILNMNKHYFCRVFKKATNTTPTEYINFVRIWKAENLLTTTKQSVLEISMEVGFSSVSYFNRIFKKLKNTNPTTYRSILYAKDKII